MAMVMITMDLVVVVTPTRKGNDAVYSLYFEDIDDLMTN